MLSPSVADVCGFCRKPVPLSEPAIEALNRTYHGSCFQCRSCHIALAGQEYYNKAGIPLCADCYQVKQDFLSFSHIQQAHTEKKEKERCFSRSSVLLHVIVLFIPDHNLYHECLHFTYGFVIDHQVGFS